MHTTHLYAMHVLADRLHAARREGHDVHRSEWRSRARQRSGIQRLRLALRSAT